LGWPMVAPSLSLIEPRRTIATRKPHYKS
jgi:hypothetical protein